MDRLILIELLLLIQFVYGQQIVEDGSYYYVCKNKKYDPQIHVCCGDRLLEIVNDKKECCINGELYNPKTSVCCNERILPKHLLGQCKCGNNSYNPETSGCCSDRVFDLSKHVCCNDNLQEKKNDQKFCCENESYDPKLFHCLSGGFISYPEFSFNKAKLVARKGQGIKQGKCPAKSTIVDEEVGCVFENCADDSNCSDDKKCVSIFLND
jgi:hypothetical protein